jgi:SAM-dependent methyltransferase
MEICNMNIWEEQVSLFPGSDEIREQIEPASAYRDEKIIHKRFQEMEFEKALENDTYPLPSAKAREGYYGDHHLSYWLSGLRDCNDLIKIYEEKTGSKPKSYMDFGGASGRVARHMSLQHDVPDVWISDINREHINFVSHVFKGALRGVQCQSIPHLPFEDNSFDLISAFSVFSHIESFDETWLLEMRRVLKPGGTLIITANIDTFQDIRPGWPVHKALVNHPDFDKTTLEKPLEQPRLVVRWNAQGSYSSVVFVRSDYAETHWKPMFGNMEIVPYLTQFQSGVVFQK